MQSPPGAFDPAREIRQRESGTDRKCA